MGLARIEDLEDEDLVMIPSWIKTEEEFYVWVMSSGHEDVYVEPAATWRALNEEDN